MTDPTTAPVNPALYFLPDGYVLPDQYIMGRQAAGASFLRAVVQGRVEGQAILGVSPHHAAGEAFVKAVAQIEPAAKSVWFPPSRLQDIARSGLFYRPDPWIGDFARQRLRVGSDAYSLCGITHTLATKETLEAIGRLVIEPVMTWDAVICTSKAALSVVETVLDEAEALNRWRFGPAVTGPRPMLPVIPLGIHTQDFVFTEADRQTSRQALGLADDEVAFLSAGRLSLHSKAHPFILLKTLQVIAEESQTPIALVFAGQAYNEAVANTFRLATQTFCPSVRSLFVDGGKRDDYRAAWAAADIFVSLADSIQETFGLTPLEAMAGGLPALVSDWDGYKETVRDGIDGFRVATWGPPIDAGDRIARDYEAGLTGYDLYLYACASGISVDPADLLQKARALVADPDLRKRMGAAGRARARSDFEWSAVYRRYRDLWAEQAARRRAAKTDDLTREWLSRAPRQAAAHSGPFHTFADFPTRHVDLETRVTLATDMDSAGYSRLITDTIVSHYIPPVSVFDAIIGPLRAGPMTIRELVAASGLAPDVTPEFVVRLAKFDLVRLEPGRGGG